ncbi:hypothetical protein TNCV_2854531 [Trichonephila clavipes]|nr:hypothetical protein TNCV_2854531 [Trichonephila clavipes]
MSSVGTSLLNEINSPKMNKEKLFSKEAKGSISTERLLTEDDLKDSDMPRSSEKQINCSVSRLNQLEEKLKELISVFELLETEEDVKKRGGLKRLKKHILSSKYREYNDEHAAYRLVIVDIPDDLKQK